MGEIDHFTTWRKKLKRARPILIALAKEGNQGNTLRFRDQRTTCVAVASHYKLESLQFVYAFQALRNTCLVRYMYSLSY